MSTVDYPPVSGSVSSKRALLAERLRQAADQSQALPLSFAQQRLWFLDQLEPDSPLYNIPTVTRLTGRLNLAALEQALEAVLERHEALRTRFVAVEGEPAQVVDHEVSCALRLQDLSNLPMTEREAEAQRRIREEINRPFNLSAESLVRTLLLQLGPEEHVLVVTMHHIVSDEWSLRVFFKELGALYAGCREGQSVVLPELPIQYGDYTLWQRNWLKEEVVENLLGFWRQQLSGSPPILELPTDHPRRVAPTFRGAHASRALSLELSEGIKQLGRRKAATLFMVLLAGFKALLYRYTRQEDIVLGAPAAGRTREETEGLIGFFVNTLPLRTRVSGALSFEELLVRVRETVLEAYAHQELPFEKMVEELQPERSLSHLPFTRLMFLVQNSLLEEAQWPGVKVQFLPATSDTAKFDLTLAVQETRRGLVVQAEYNADLFETATIERLLEHFETLLQGVVAEPKRCLAELPLLSAAEVRQVLVEWNDARTVYPRDKCVHELFEAQAERTPGATAVVCRGESLTYGELNARANQLAHYLRQQFGVGPDVPVGLCVERSLDLVVGLLGILKAGGAYVPLDAGYPPERLAFMLKDTQAPVLLTHQRLFPQVFPHGEAGAARLDGLGQPAVVCLDADWELIAPECTRNLPNLTRADSLAYVMYTSGSTGEPKGVEVPHRGITRLVLATNYIRFDATDHVAQVSNVSFDAATFEVWGALLNGGQLVVISQDVALSPKDFARELQEQGITAMFLTAALFNQLAGAVPGAFARLRTLIAGGEALEPKWVRAVLKARPPQRLVNGYGPTENTTFTCCYEIRELGAEATQVPIGRPIANTQVYILDPQLQPVPVGVPGELYAGGDGVARGYWRRPQLTAEKFISNPFAPAGSGQLLYKTGDLARYRADGNIEFLGRLDRQVKIRGFRIELGEIETALGKHPGVSECVVVASGTTTADRRLVAYFVPAGAGIPNASELRTHLAERLPEYMMPAAFVQLNALPLTPNGKVDRQALPEPDQTRPELERKYAPPRDEVERQLVGIWEQVLGIHPVGVADKFFDLGGHSLLAVRATAKIEKVFGRKLRVATIFQAPTIEQLAAILREEVKESSIATATSLVEIQGQGSRPPLFLVHGAGGGMFWGYANLARHLGTDQPVYGFKSRGLDGRQELSTIPELAAQYLADLRSRQPQGPYYLGGYCFGGDVAYEMARQLEAQGQRVGLLALFNCVPPNNARYSRIPWTPQWALRFVHNLFTWARYFLQWTPSQRLGFFRWKWTVLKRKLTRSEGVVGQELARVDAGDLVDLSSYSDEERNLWETHIRALLEFHPQSYNGPVRLFRSAGYPLWCSFDPAFGWGGLAQGGVQITMVPGAHEKILEEPHVRVLAAELAKALEVAQETTTVGDVRPSPICEPSRPAAGNESGEPDEQDAPSDQSAAHAEALTDTIYPEQFQLQVARTPERLAARFQGQELTYAELNARANQLAHFLQAQGVGPEVLVGVCLERSLELVVALLAVLKAGGAYLPLDPEYPQERLAYMLADSRAQWLLTETRFKGLTAEHVVCLDAPAARAQLSRCSQENLVVQTKADNLAYVIYTSGSTGAPKGVQVTHRSLLSHNFAVARTFQLEPTDRVLQFTPLSFDVSVEELFPSWLSGCAVILRSEEAISSTARFLELVEREAITVLNLPTAFWHELVETLQTRALPAAVRLVVIGGERASEQAFRQWKERVGARVTLMNGYGVTEATVTTTLGVARAEAQELPIGQPLPGMHVVILDEQLRPVPPGEAGELCIGGPGVARGYLNRPDLTAERFISHPGVPSGRLYRTGDRARLREDGNLEFLGRQDEQVKIRGFRIELGEVEAVLRQHPGVADAAVVAREDQPGKKRLVAYFVPRTAAAPRVGELLKHFYSKVPDYMAPSVFVPLVALPKTPAGKVDRQALPKPSGARPDLDEPLVASQTPVQEVLAEIWAEVLELQPVGINDNFFELGGHSLLAMQVLSRVREQLQVDVPLESFFARPTLASLAEHLTEASDQARPVLPASVLARGRQVELSPVQRRIWFLDQFEPHRAAYNRALGLRLEGALDVPTLERNLTELTRRHDILRAVFPALNGEPIQLVCAPREVSLRVFDLSGEPAEQREAKAKDLLARQARQPHITFGPMLRPLLLRLSSTEHWLLVVLHEIGVDSRSAQLLLGELAELYDALAPGNRSSLPALPARTAEGGEPGGRLTWTEDPADKAYWKAQLAGAPALLELPTDRPRPPHHGAAGARHAFALPALLMEQVAELSQKEGCSLFATLLAAFETVLHRYTGCSDLVIGSVASGRVEPESAESEQSIGHFENPVALRCDLSGDPAFRELLGRVETVASGAWAHSNYRFEALLEELHPERNATYTPVFQVMFVLDERPSGGRQLNGLRLVPFEVDNQTAKYDLTLHLSTTSEGLAGWMEYSTELFEPARISRLAEHFTTLLAGAVAHPSERLSALPLLGPAERHQLLVEWNSTAVDYPRDCCLHELIEEQVERTPEATAVVFDGHRLTYRELNARANQLAHRLRTQGVGPDTLVGVHVERSLEMVVGLLGTLKAGGAYVPLDPEYPRDRLAFMLEDAGVSVLLTQTHLTDSLPPHQARVLRLDTDWPEIASENTANPRSGVQAHHLAYMIYTSGSTGRPKGALNTHVGIVNRLLWMQDAYRLSPTDRVLQKTPFSFDVSVWEFFWPLLTGATLVFARPGGHRDAAYLARLIAQEKITTLHFVPSMLRLFLEEPELEVACATVKRVICSGEALPLDLQERFFARLPAELHNLYGPTEAAVDVTYWACQRNTSLRTVPIGKPIANIQIYILDRQLQPVPSGIAGELHIGGIGLARGYHRRPELTAEKFIPNPFSSEPGARLYKTGDLARFLPDGNIEYLGRMDHQVKIRGYRIELGEIEAALKEYSGVTEALVLAREDAPGDKRLVAYVVRPPGQEITDAELRRFLEQKLPAYMVPASFVQMEALPLTPNGKVDRKALATAEAEQPKSRAGFVAPRTPVEEQVAAIWREVLRVKQVGAEDNFFDLGGDSLLAIRVISRIREVFRVELPLFRLFNAPTVALLAEGLGSGQWTPNRSMVLPLQPISRGAQLPVSFVQERLWFLDQLEPGSPAYNVPMALRLKGTLDAAALEKAFNEVIRRHEALRTTFSFEEDELSQVILPSLRLELERMPTTSGAGPGAAEPDLEGRVQGWLNSQAQRPFDLARGPLVRAGVAQINDSDHVLLVVLHHSICDGWSLALLFQELAALYSAFATGRPAPALPELPVQYADFAYWQRRWMQGAVLGQELSYWQQQLAGAPTAVQLPSDRPEPAEPSSRGRRLAVQVPESVTSAMAALSQREGDTPFMVLMTALVITLHQWTTQKDLVIGTVVAGRNRREVENLIGCFMNFLPIRTQVQEADAGQAILARVRTAVLEAQTHQNCPFERIVEALNPKRGLNRNPLYNVALLLQNFPSELFQTETLQPSVVPVEMEAALLDLRFEAEQVGNALSLSCEYRTDLFEPATIQELLASFRQVLEMLVRAPQTRVSAFQLTPGLLGRRPAIQENQTQPQLAIAATFTAEPVAEPVRHWLQELELPATVEFAPYNQVFQQLLDPASLLARNQQGLNLVLLRLEDWRRSGTSPGPEDTQGITEVTDEVQRNVREFLQALEAATARSAVPWLVCLCPASSRVAADAECAGALTRIEQALAAELARLGNVQVLTSTELARWYPVADYYDASADELGHVPYTPLFFTALGTAMVRKYHALQRAPFKVIALDCDQTLWAGVCGEDGPNGVRLDAPYQALQAFMRAQRDAGMLLCLCSKNNATDVDAVFAQRSEMPLRPEHFAARRLNWRPKSENLKSLAQELHLGLDAFILLDDNPVECAEVEANSSEVLTLRLPEDPRLLPQFLEHCWAFDHLKLTAEDRRRAALYQENRHRERFRAESPSLAGFLEGLELKVQIEPIAATHLARAAELTQRTNQFNCTTRRRSEGELQQFLRAGEGLVVSLSDRFGDYGLVGLMLFRSESSTLVVDSFLLSCRALGRGVEHRMLSRLGELARERRLDWVDVHFAPTPKNQPAAQFLESVGRTFQQALNGGSLFRFPTAHAAEVAFNPPGSVATSAASARDARPETSRSSGRPQQFRRYRELALEANDPVRIHQRLQASAAAPAVQRRAEYLAPRTETERTLCALWEQLLHVEQVGVNDNFFDLGGHSLLAVQLNSRIRATFQVELPMQSLFEAQTIAALAEGLAAGKWQRASTTEPPLQPVSRQTAPPLSFAQQRLWFIDQLEPNSPLYNVPVLVRLRGKLDRPALERSLQRIVARHESLRTRFVSPMAGLPAAAAQDSTAGGPVQVIEPHVYLPVRQVDLSNLPETEREAEARRVLREEANRPFKLSTGPLLRALLVRLAPEEHLLLLNLHHIVSDEWSFGLLFRELVTLYSGQEAQLPQLSVQYADYAVWQRQSLQGAVYEQHLAYWKSQLGGQPPVTELPTDHRRLSPPRFRGRSLKRALDNDLSRAVQELAKREDVTLFMALLATFKALVHRWNQHEEILVGSPSAGRNRVEIENLIGFFVNTLPLRTNLSGDPTFSELLQRVRTVTLAAFAHQDLPFEKIVEALQPERSLDHMPFTKLMFVFQHAFPEEMQLPELRLQFMELESETAKFDLTLTVEETSRGLMARAEYNTDLFEPATIQHLLQQYETLLRAIVAQPQLRLSELPLLAQAERQHLLERWSRSVCGSSEPRYLHQWFEAQAERTPEATALVFEEQRLTYAQLNAQANQLAHYLQGLGVGPEVPVALCLERSLEMVVAILGVLKAGGAYVPLDPAYPPQRLAFMLEDTAAPVLLTQSHLRSKLPAQAQGVVCLDTEQEPLRAGSTHNPQPATRNPQHAAYIIYTSGSSGTPKGVVVSHANVVRLLEQTQSWYHFNEQDTWTLFHSYSFDFSVWELWGALLYGGRLVIVPYLVSRSPGEFYQLLSREQVTVLNQTPSAFRQLLWAEAAAPEPLPLNLRYVIFGGEALELQSLAPWFERHGDKTPQLINMYGITETTVHVTYRPIRASDLNKGLGSVIGVPIPDLRLYLLDEKLEPVPAGVPGEIWVGGAGVARGYLNRPELNEQRFMADPFVAEPGARLYRSGDLARYSAEGELEYLGRKDQQVKVRGFRVELGEIESALQRHPAIRESVVVAEQASGGQRLVGYFVGEATSSEVREFLSKSLPEHMVPSVLVSLEALPLTANGKVDRKALPAPEPMVNSSEPSPAPPRNPMEARLAEIWCQVLGRQAVGIHDNFFHLGGHSLLATQALFRIAEAFQVELPVRVLFEAPTVAGLAQALAQAQRQPPAGQPALVRRTRAPNAPCPLSYAQEMLWVQDRLEPGCPLYNIPLVARLKGQLDGPALERALEAVVARHEVLRSRLVEQEGRPEQVLEVEPAITLRQVDLRGEPQVEGRARELLTQEINQPFDLGRERLLRGLLLRLKEQEHLLALSVHHIVFDEWSLEIFFRELGACYQAELKGERALLPELPVQYADYALWERQWLQGPVLEEHLAFWKEQLAGAPPPTELPTDYPRPAGAAWKGGLERRLLSAELGAGLKQLALREGSTLFMVLLAAFKSLLYRYTQQADLVVASPMAGRHRWETEGLVGFFVNVLPLRSHLDGQASFKELLQQEREVALGAYAHQEVPFGKLVEALQPERSAQQMPFSNLMFLVQNQLLEQAHWPGLELEFIEERTPTSKFDLTLMVQESAQGLLAQVEYKSELFEPSTITRLLEHFETLLQGIVADATQKVAELPLMSEPEKEQVLLQWNQTQREYPREKTLVDLFLEQVARTPEAEALVSGETRLSYRELARRSQEVACRLQELGVGSETPVGICLERSWPMVAAILGTLQAGGTYVPLDPTYPQERLAFMLEDAGVKVVVTQEKLLGALNPKAEDREPKEGRSAKAELAYLCLDQIPWDTEALHASRITHHAPPPAPSHLAYIIYTSGSTGQPKGVALEHRSAVALMHWAKESYGPEELSGVLAATSICFDLSVFELFVPLSWGGKVILADNALALAELSAAREVSLINTVPSAMRELLRLKAVPASVRVVNLAGEPLSPALVEQIYRETQVGKVYDLYGPTETTTYSTGGLREPGARASIGRPLSNEEVYVLDPQRQPVPIGVAGEIYIGGEGLARGYLKRPQLTAERFVAHPFQAGARLYRTGDLGRWRAEGTLEYLGRLDQQVKVRGFRIELGEIEAALRSQPAVEQAIVVARETASGDKQLVAYVVARAGESLVETDLRTKLEAHLPAYMVPAHLVNLPALPLTANGKVDRKQLTAIEPRPASGASAPVAPRNATETMLADIWREVLGVESVGIHDNFFRLGGHSLLAVRLFARIAAVTGQKLPLVTVFQAPTIEQMARVLGESHTGAVQSLLVPIQPNGTRPPLFLVHGAGGDVLWGYANLSSHLSPDQPVYGIKSRGQAGLPELTRVEDMASCYLEAVRAFQPQGPYYLGGYCFGGNLACEMARQLLLQGEQVAFVVLLDSAPANIGYEVAPWWRPSYLVRFVRNLGIWLADFTALPGYDRRTFVARKLRAYGRHLKRRLRRELGPEPVDLEGFIDLSHFSETELKLWRIHLEAASTYIQPTYPGAVTLLRTRGQPLLCSLDEDFCWSRVAQGGVAVKRIPGSHESIFTEPNVQHLAQQLETCLAQARAQTAPVAASITDVHS